MSARIAVFAETTTGSKYQWGAQLNSESGGDRDNPWNVYFDPLKPGRFYESKKRIEDEYVKLKCL